jgi:hypothetical protein
MKYLPANGARLSEAEAQIIGERLEWLEKKYGFYTPEIVVRDAKEEKDSPLKRFFLGKEKAYAIYLIDRARELIESIRIEIPEAEEPVRASQSIRLEGPKYVNTPAVLNDQAMSRQCVERGIRALTSWQRQFGFFPELKDASLRLNEIIAEYEARWKSERMGVAV